MCPFILHCVIYYFWDCYTTLQDWCNFISSYRMPSVLSLTPAVQWSSLAVQLTTAHSPFEQCCPPHWTSCCCPACPSEWSLTDRRAWAKCHTGWRTCATPRCRLWVKLYHPGDSALSAVGQRREFINQFIHKTWLLFMLKITPHIELKYTDISD